MGERGGNCGGVGGGNKSGLGVVLGFGSSVGRVGVHGEGIWEGRGFGRGVQWIRANNLPPFWKSHNSAPPI